MRNLLCSVQLWSYVVLMLCLSLVAISLGILWGWMPGTASVVLLMLPVCFSALSGSRGLAAVTAVLCIASMTAEFVARGVEGMGTEGISFPLLSACVLFAMSLVVSTYTSAMQRELKKLDEQNTEQLRELYSRNRVSDVQTDEEPPATEESEATQPIRDSNDGSVNHAMLLLTLMDIGRRIGNEVDFDTLIPTIISTARASLKCGKCQIFLWNPREQSLHNALPSRARDRDGYVPHPEKGMAAWVLQHRQILTRKDIEGDYKLQHMIDTEPDLPAAIAPLWVGSEVLGLIIVDDVNQESPAFVQVLYILSTHYALGIKNAQLFKRIEDMARRDSLTGLLNHASFHEEIDKQVELAQANASPLSIIMCDVDHFKRVNDTYGHQAGDHVLRNVARLFQAVLPSGALLARYGGEEFICALPGERWEQARELAELLRQSLEKHPLDFEGHNLNITASFGVAAHAESAADSATIIRLADEALYRAKTTGRNRVVYGDPAAAHVRQESQGDVALNAGIVQLRTT